MTDAENTQPPLAPWWARYAKAIYGAVLSAGIAFLAALLPYLTGVGLEGVRPEGWATAALMALTALAGVGGTVAQVTNRKYQVKGDHEA